MIVNSQNSLIEVDYSKKEVLAQLDRLLTHEMFVSSTVLSNFLRFVVTEALEGKTAELKEYTIGVSALGKKSDFKPQTDAIVRIHAGRLRRLLAEYYSGPGLNDTIKIDLIKGSYVPLFRSHTATAADLKDVHSNGGRAAKFTRSKLTIAVLPFRNLCANNEFQFFADGMGEELTRSFSLYQDIAVIAHHSTRKFAIAQDDLRTIGSELGAHYLITGTVMRTSQEIKVSVGLSETVHSTQFWSKAYHYKLNIENLIRIQDEIIDNVCSILGGHYGFIIRDGMISRRAHAPDILSFDAALWNYYFHMNFTRETYLETCKALEVALQHDPNYAEGLAMLAELYLDAYTLGYPTVENPIEESYRLVHRATRIDPQCQHAALIYGWANIYLKNKENAVAAIEYSLQLNPSSVSVTGSAGFGMACAGVYDRAFELLSKSTELNPHHPWWFNLGFFLILFHQKNYEQALEYANKLDATDVYIGPLCRAASKGMMNLSDDAKNDVKMLTQCFPHITKNLRKYFTTFLIDEKLADAILEGARKAGLQQG